ncbi:MAG: hypothetical protein K2R98_01125 [Gemmataceae bacterium]|nr:hypothetical protein [Gemmataceae bacterium]
MTFPDLPLTAEERALFDRAARWPGCAWAELTPERVQQLAASEGIAFATALLYDRVRRAPEHGSFIERIESMPESEGLVPRDLTVAIVPGGFHVEHPDSGADGRFLLEQAKALGLQTAVVPLGSFPSLRENARRLCDWLRRRPDERMILVSLSKGSAEVRLALDEPDAALLFRNVAAWVNISGLVYGTPLVRWLFERRPRAMLIRLLFWLRGYSYAGLQELDRGPAGLLDGELRIPEHVTVVHLLGFPLATHMSRPLAQRGYRRIAPLGPNDGGSNLLADMTKLPGLIYPVWGADHYMQPAWDVSILIRRLFRFLGEEPARRPALVGSKEQT